MAENFFVMENSAFSLEYLKYSWKEFAEWSGIVQKKNKKQKKSAKLQV